MQLGKRGANQGRIWQPVSQQHNDGLDYDHDRNEGKYSSDIYAQRAAAQMDEVVDLTLYSDLPSSDGNDESPERPLTRKTIGTLLRPVAVHPCNVSKVPISDDTTRVSNSATNNALPWQAIASFKPQGQTGWDRENKFIHLPESLFKRPQRRIHEAGSNKLSKTTNSSQKNGGTTFHKCTQDNAKEESTRPRLSWMAVCEKNCDEKYSTMVQDIKNLDLKNMLLIELPRTASRDTKPVTHRKTISIPLVPFESDATNDVEEGDKSLPQGWRELTSHTTGHTYYGNIYTGESVWKRPTTCAIADSSPRKSQQLRTMTGLLSDQPLSRRTVRTDVKKGSEEPVPHNSIKHLPRNKGICGQIEQWKPEAARAKPGVTPEILPADQHNPNVVGVSEAPLAHRVDLSTLPPTQTTDQPSVRFGFMPKASMMCFSCFTLPVRRHVTRKHSDETRSISAEHSKGQPDKVDGQLCFDDGIGLEILSPRLATPRSMQSHSDLHRRKNTVYTEMVSPASS